MAAQIFSAIFVIVVGVGGCVAYFWGANKLLDLIFPSRGVERRGGGRQSAPARHDPAVAVRRPGDDHPDHLPDLSGGRDAQAFLPRPRRRRFRRPGQLPLGVRRPRVPQLDPQQHAVAGRGAGRLHLPRAGHRRAHRPHLVGHHRQEPDLPAAGHLVRRRQRHLEVHLRLSRRGPDPDRHPQRHRPGSRRRSRRSGYRCRSGTISS